MLSLFTSYVMVSPALINVAYKLLRYTILPSQRSALLPRRPTTPNVLGLSRRQHTMFESGIDRVVCRSAPIEITQRVIFCIVVFMQCFHTRRSWANEQFKYKMVYLNSPLHTRVT